jgi:hypothetical protein
MAKTNTTKASDAASDARTPSDRNKRAVVVTTQHRGVFFGYVAGLAEDQSVRITRARNCIYWARTIGGFMGLAASGPNAECRIGAQVPAITLTGVTSVVECTPEATQAWEAAPCFK